jgi:amino-acid N-acetyltransferase
MHRGKTFVVGIAGEAIAAGKLQHIAQDLALIQSMGVKVVLVHGFRPQVNEQLKAKGHAARYSHGMRITDEVRARLRAGSRRPAALRDRGRLQPGPAQHADGRLHGARDLGQLHHRAAGGHRRRRRLPALGPGAQGRRGRHQPHAGLRARMVLISPFGFSPTGEAFNLTMEEVATSVAIALQADKLIFLTEIPACASSRWSRERGQPDRHRAAAGRGRTAAGSLPPAQNPTDTAFYLQHCVKACKAGVERSHIIPSPSTARCCWRSTCTTASARW